MIFRNSDGKLVELNKDNFTNDILYYTKLMDIKKNQYNIQSETLNNTVDVETTRIIQKTLESMK